MGADRTATEGTSAVSPEVAGKGHLPAAATRGAPYLDTMLRTAPIGLLVVDSKGLIRLCAGQAMSAVGLTPERAMGRSVEDAFSDVPQVRDNIQRAMAGETCVSAMGLDGRAYQWLYAPWRDAAGRIVGGLGVAADITAMEETGESPPGKSGAPREPESAGREGRSRIGRLIADNMDRVIMPILRDLRRGLPRHEQARLQFLEAELRDIVAPYVGLVSQKAPNMSQAETRICEMIREGLSSKEIADLERISPATVAKHRQHIREKLGITSEQVNLTTFLQSLRIADAPPDTRTRAAPG